jgi:hypothetical protein
LEKEHNGSSETITSAMTLLLEEEGATGVNIGMEAAYSVDCSDRIWPEDTTGTNERAWCEMDELFEGEPHAKRAKAKHFVDGV